jgi:arabinose-5-phosphate isomerase
MRARSFTPEDFARFHPGGTLGRGLKLRVGDLMRSGARMAHVTEAMTVRDALDAITRSGGGSVVVVAPEGALAGYLTDGDVRRLLLRSADAEALLRTAVAAVMTRTPLSFTPELPALNALRGLQERGVDDAPVVDEANRPVGILDVQELLRAGLL